MREDIGMYVHVKVKLIHASTFFCWLCHKRSRSICSPIPPPHKSTVKELSGRSSLCPIPHTQYTLSSVSRIIPHAVLPLTSRYTQAAYARRHMSRWTSFIFTFICNPVRLMVLDANSSAIPVSLDISSLILPHASAHCGSPVDLRLVLTK